MATAINHSARFCVGLTARGFCLVERVGISRRQVTEPEPTALGPTFLALQLRTASQARRDAFLRANGCGPMPVVGQFKGILV